MTWKLLGTVLRTKDYLKLPYLKYVKYREHFELPCAQKIAWNCPKNRKLLETTLWTESYSSYVQYRDHMEVPYDQKTT
jgi:hypothetical protein